MTYELQGRLSLKIVFNNEEFLFKRANSFDFIHMVCSTRIGVPMLHMALQDNIGFLSETKHLGDAARIQIVVSGRDNSSQTYIWRLNHFQRQENGGGIRYEIDAYLDCSTYWHASTKEAISGTSKKVLSTIASNCGLLFDGPETSDDQLWLPRNRNYFEWAQSIAERGYRADGSCMQMGLNFNRVITYRDLADPRPVAARFNFGGYKEGTMLASAVSPSMSSGSMNHFSGYADMAVEQDLETSSVTNPVAQVQVALKSSEGSLQMNSQVKKAIERSRVRFAPIDTGNVHPNYEKALYQNRRVNNLFSTRVDLVTPNVTNVNLLDTVDVTIDGPYQYLKPYTGQYQVSSRVIRLLGNEYFEKLELLRKTINGSLST